jgi:hypothetical protein
MIQEKFDKNKVWNIYRDVVQFGMSRLEGMTEFECMQIKLFAQECRQKGFMDAAIIYQSYIENNSSILNEIPVEYKDGREIEYFGLKHCNYYQDGDFVIRCIDEYLSKDQKVIERTESKNKFIINYKMYAEEAANSILNVFPNWESSNEWESVKAHLINYLLNDKECTKYADYATKLMEMVEFDSINFEITPHPLTNKNTLFNTYQTIKDSLSNSNDPLYGRKIEQFYNSNTAKLMAECRYGILLTPEYLKIIGGKNENHGVSQNVKSETKEEKKYTEKQFALTYKLLVDLGKYENPYNAELDEFEKNKLIESGKNLFHFTTSGDVFYRNVRKLNYKNINYLLSERLVKKTDIDIAKEIELKYLNTNHLS